MRDQVLLAFGNGDLGTFEAQGRQRVGGAVGVIEVGGGAGRKMGEARDFVRQAGGFGHDATAAASSRPVSTSVSSISALGSTFKVRSVRRASVP